MQTISLAQVVKAAQKFYDKGRLMAQMPAPRVGGYKVASYRCAIGAVFTTGTLKALKAKGLTDFAIGSGLVTLQDQRDFEGIKAIQDAHDKWAALGDTHKSAFLKLIGR